jgi:hypothetical protein
VSDKKKWVQPPDLAAYDEYTFYPGRAEELINSDATYHSNVIVAVMAAETAAQYSLLARLRDAGLLKAPHRAKPDCVVCGSHHSSWCPDCGACKAGCHDAFRDNPCKHTKTDWWKGREQA